MGQIAANTEEYFVFFDELTVILENNSVKIKTKERKKKKKETVLWAAA